MPFEVLWMYVNVWEPFVSIYFRSEAHSGQNDTQLVRKISCYAAKRQALGTRAYEASRMDHTNANAMPTPLGGGGNNAGGNGEEGLSADHQLLCQIGNCLQLEAVSAMNELKIISCFAWLRCYRPQNEAHVRPCLLCAFKEIVGSSGRSAVFSKCVRMASNEHPETEFR